MESRGERTAVLGAGSWGTALAIHLARSGRETVIWGNEADHLQEIAATRRNDRFLPGIDLPDSLLVEPDLKTAISGSKRLLIVIPSHAIRGFLAGCSDIITGDHEIIWASKGLEDGTAKLLHEVIGEELPQCGRLAVISGPTFAKEVASDLPTAITVASTDSDYASVVCDLFHHGNFRAYASEDVIGVELGGALKNVLAIAAGAADGLGYGANTRAAVITRGLNEIMRLGELMGGRRETFMGLAGIGDLVLTCTDDQSRNRRMGLLLAQGMTIDEARNKIGQEVEGLKTAKEAWRLAERYDIELAIIGQVYSVLYEGTDPHDAVRYLLSRKTRHEMD